MGSLRPNTLEVFLTKSRKMVPYEIIFSSLATSGVIENSFGKSVHKYISHLATLGQKLSNEFVIYSRNIFVRSL